MPQRPIAAFSFILAALAALSAAIGQPIVVEDIVRETPGGRIRGFIATVDLTDPQVEIVVTGSGTGGAEADLATTTSFRSATGSRLAINANFFSTSGVPAGKADIIGLSMTNGVLVSPVRQFGALPDPALAFTQQRLASIGNFGPADLSNVWDAVAGVGPSNTDSDPGTFLITDGTNTGATARVTPATREPRTAVGVNATGTRLYMIVIDGRQSTWSVGVTLPELADLLLERGVWRAINLDGGGSSSFVWLNDANVVISNRPSDGSPRAVANHLGIKLNPPAAITDRVVRPIRGAWLRPPSTIAAFETAIAPIAGAGIQDLFLETLYWGRDTGVNNVPEFPARFTSNGLPVDYLAQAIAISARYGMRVHAWCETGYLDFGNSPSPFLAANPSYVVDHRDPANTITGDIANQRFVNLGNPGVRTALNSYFSALTTNYPGLEGIQADYHFYPLAGSSAAPWSFDSWGRAAYQAQFGIDPINEVNLAATSFPTRWLTFNRGNITEALVQLRSAVDGVSSSPLLSAVAFADWSSGFHTSKMIDLPGWGTTNASELYIHMAYFTGLTTVPGSNPPRNLAIDTDISRMITAVPNKRVVVGLANLTNQTRASITVQLDTVKGRGLEEFVWFDAPTFNNNAGFRTELQNWIANRAQPLQGDVTATGTSNGRDSRIDARDLAWFNTVYTGSPVTRTATNDRCDLNRNNIIDATDLLMLHRAFFRYRCGEDGVIDGRDVATLRAAFTPGPAPNPAILNLWDLNGDGAVDVADEVILNTALTTSFPPNLDVNNDGLINYEDYRAWNRTPTDVNRDGSVNAADLARLELGLRGLELDIMRVGQQ